ncbi:MAG: nucleoside-diphosphate kinase [Candidatus Altiarchaeota archaeon]|nr:nucleoside-diphosphate kinase [Candidatus Altiarchaeota archaeon]
MTKERSFVMLKPEVAKRQLVGKIISRLEESGLKLVAMKLVKPTPTMVENHYPSDNEWLISVGNKSIGGYKKLGMDITKEMKTNDPLEIGKIIKGWLIKYVSSSPVVAMVWEGNRAIDIIRKLAGNTEPLSADSGTVRGDFAFDSFEHANRQFRALFNMMHASATTEEAKNEISLWFNQSEIFDYKTGIDLIWKDLLEKIK